MRDPAMKKAGIYEPNSSAIKPGKIKKISYHLRQKSIPFSSTSKGGPRPKMSSIPLGWES